LNTNPGDSTKAFKEMVKTRVWKDILTTIDGLLILPLSEASSDMKLLTDKEVETLCSRLKCSR